MKLHRPYIPMAVRVEVARRQLTHHGAMWLPSHTPPERGKQGKWLKTALILLFKGESCELDHVPALCNRKFNKRTGKYKPAANDPDYLWYRLKIDHDIKTRIHGEGAQRSDLAQRRYLKRVAKNRARGNVKKKWPKRPLRSGGWPKRRARS